MLKKRLIAVLTIKQGIVVQTINFERYLPVGKPKIAVEYLNQWGIDEIVFVDIDASARGECISPKLVQEVSRFTHSPLTVGGGIRTVDQMKELIASGADKISINRACREDKKLISRGAEIFGNQCIMVSLDIQKTDGKYEVYDHVEKRSTGLDPISYAREVEKLGAGEILANFVHRNGSKQGYDLEMAQSLSSAVGIPVIICGGVGHPKHFVEGLNIPNVSAVAAGNFFHYQEHSAVVAKRYILQNSKQPVRLDSYVNYQESGLDQDGRLSKKDDAELEKLFFEFHQREII